MRHKNSVRQLGRTQAHRRAMFANMVTSLLMHERIVTTKQKGKELKRISEKIITRAKRNLVLLETEPEKKLHNKREVMKLIKNRDAIKKLFDELAGRFQERKGGYTRLYLIGRRNGDAAEMAIVELVDRKAPEPKKKSTDKDEKEKKDKK